MREFEVKDAELFADDLSALTSFFVAKDSSGEAQGIQESGIYIFPPSRYLSSCISSLFLLLILFLVATKNAGRFHSMIMNLLSVPTEQLLSQYLSVPDSHPTNPITKRLVSTFPLFPIFSSFYVFILFILLTC